MAGKPKDYTGKRYGNLVAKYRLKDNHSKYGYKWMFSCSCGVEEARYPSKLCNGSACSKCCKSTKRDAYPSSVNRKIKSMWEGMHNRCNNTQHRAYAYYGGMGIKVSDCWATFQPFYDWVCETGYREGLSLDRKDFNKDYNPDNCEWVEKDAQSRNKSLPKNNKTSVIGVCETQGSYRASVYFKGKCTVRSFSIKTYGREGALKLAIEARESLLKMLELEHGVVYGDNHGGIKTCQK